MPTSLEKPRIEIKVQPQSEMNSKTEQRIGEAAVDLYNAKLTQWLNQVFTGGVPARQERKISTPLRLVASMGAALLLAISVEPAAARALEAHKIEKGSAETPDTGTSTGGNDDPNDDLKGFDATNPDDVARYLANAQLKTETVPETEVDPTVTEITAEDLDQVRMLSERAEAPEGVETALINNGRFKIEVTWENNRGETGTGKIVQFNEEGAYIWFFNKNNPEIILKIKDACSFNETFWTFVAGLTNVKFDITLTDTITGEERIVSNPLGQVAQPFQTTREDQGAFGADVCNAEVSYTPTTAGNDEVLIPIGDSNERVVKVSDIASVTGDNVKIIAYGINSNSPDQIIPLSSSEVETRNLEAGLLTLTPEGMTLKPDPDFQGNLNVIFYVQGADGNVAEGRCTFAKVGN